MLDCDNLPTRTTLRSRTALANSWLLSLPAQASPANLIAVEAERMVFHSAKGDWLFNIDWGGIRIVVTDAQDVGSPCWFKGLKPALALLDALFMHHSVHEHRRSGFADAHRN